MEQVKGKRDWQPTERDRVILKQIGEHGFSSARWIKDHFSRGKSNCNHYRRLSVLRKMGLIEDLLGDAGKKLGYRLTKKGIKLLDGTEYRAAYRTTYNHDDYLVGLGATFQKLPGVIEYWPEHQVRKELARRHGYKERTRDGYKVPDALFTVQTKQRKLRIALELEIALKAKAYYRRILRKLAISADFDMVFIVTPDSKTMGLIMEELTFVRANDPVVKFGKRDNGFYFALMPDVLTEKENAKFQGEGTAFTLAQLAS